MGDGVGEGVGWCGGGVGSEVVKKRVGRLVLERGGGGGEGGASFEK